MSNTDKAVAWWVNVLRDAKKDNGDRSEMGAMALAMAELGKKVPTEDQLERFAQLLHERIESEHPTVLSCDYGPSVPLRECAKEAGIDGSAFPWKTTMWLRPDKVEVSYGYGAPIQEVSS